MTTPTEPVSGLRMPYAVVAKIEPSRDAFRLLPEHENYEGSTPQYRLGVPGGASIIAASYDGPESVRLELSREGISRSLFTIPEKSGGGHASGPQFKSPPPAPSTTSQPNSQPWRHRHKPTRDTPCPSASTRYHYRSNPQAVVA